MNENRESVWRERGHGDKLKIKNRSQVNWIEGQHPERKSYWILSAFILIAIAMEAFANSTASLSSHFFSFCNSKFSGYFSM